MASADATQPGRRRTDRGATPTPEPAGESRSSHTADPFLDAFRGGSFDPAAYLNATLPPLGRRHGPGQGGPEPVALDELSAQAQALLSQLNAQMTRLSHTLTQLTDDILRSGSRLAYEVELLRGEALSLSESLHETLRDDIEHFVPGGLRSRDGAAAAPAAAEGQATERQATGRQAAEDPNFIKQLQTLTLVRSRLDAVIKTFGDAMDFVFPPSELSVSSSFLSVLAPEPGPEQQSSEEKGQQTLKKLRDEISGLLSAGDDPVQGIERAAGRVEELKELASVWKGTAEEKGRNRFIESLAKLVEDRHRELMRDMDHQAAAGKEQRGRPGGPAQRARRARPRTRERCRAGLT